MRGRQGVTLVNAWRLIIGTLSILPVQAPHYVTAATVRGAVVLAPIVGALVALIVAIPAWLLGRDLPPLVAAALCVAAVAFLTRAIHLDGLADTADGLGANRDRDGTLAVMRRSDIGPFGVVTLVLVLLIQVVALAACFEAGIGAPVLAIALVLSRASLARLCTHPPARHDGLGAGFAGSTSDRDVLVTVLLSLLLCLPVYLASGETATGQFVVMVQVLLHPLAVVPGWWLTRGALRRIGGLTGDIYGGVIELAFTSSLVMAALAMSLA